MAGLEEVDLDLGARWEYWPADRPQYPGGSVNYNPVNNTLILSGFGNNPMDMGVKNYPRNIYPRLGFAWRLNEKTVIRAGFGMSSSYRYLHRLAISGKTGSSNSGRESFVAAGSMAEGFPAPIPVRSRPMELLPMPPIRTTRSPPANIPCHMSKTGTWPYNEHCRLTFRWI